MLCPSIDGVLATSLHGSLGHTGRAPIPVSQIDMLYILYSVGSYIRFTGASSLVHLVHWITRCTGALVHWCTGSPVAPVHWCSGLPGAPVHGALVRAHRCTGSLVHWFTWCTGALVLWLGHTGALMHWFTWFTWCTGSPGACFLGC